MSSSTGVAALAVLVEAVEVVLEAKLLVSLLVDALPPPYFDSVSIMVTSNDRLRWNPDLLALHGSSSSAVTEPCLSIETNLALSDSSVCSL